MRRDVGAEKARLLSDFQQYLAKRPASDEVMERTRQSIAKMNALDELKNTYELIDEGKPFDIEPPNDDDSCWTMFESIGDRALTPAGRNKFRKMIDDERVRRREAKAWWWKTVIIPSLAAITGIVGSMTGLIAVLKK